MNLDKVPLCVDLDGTLLFDDLLKISTRKLLREKPLQFVVLLRWLFCGKALFKKHVADQVKVDVECLPYNNELLAWVREERENGRHVVLCTGSNTKYAHSVAEYLRCFDEVLASDDRKNLIGEVKAAELCCRYGKKKYDYVGNSFRDIPAWRYARKVILVSNNQKLIQKVKDEFPEFYLFGSK